MLNNIITWLTDYSEYPARRLCGTWENWEWITMQSCEYFIGACYFFIPLFFYGLYRGGRVGVYFLSKNPTHIGSGLLGSILFIFSCGITHIINGIIFFIPMYPVYLVAIVCCALINVWNVILLIQYGAVKGLFSKKVVNG